MTLRLTPEALASAYDFLRSTEPFCRWNLPEPEDIKFVVVRSPTTRGWYTRKGGKHAIAVSQKCTGRTQSLIEVMAHEMVHLHQAETCMETGSMHNAAFNKIAARVCKIHGFDPQLF